MRTWLVLLSGLLVWTAHFFGVYGAASLFPGSVVAHWLTGLLTLSGLGALAFLALPLLRRRGAGDRGELSHWIDGVALLGIALAGVAILYQGVPAFTA